MDDDYRFAKDPKICAFNLFGCLKQILPPPINTFSPSFSIYVYPLLSHHQILINLSFFSSSPFNSIQWPPSTSTQTHRSFMSSPSTTATSIANSFKNFSRFPPSKVPLLNFILLFFTFPFLYLSSLTGYVQLPNNSR